MRRPRARAREGWLVAVSSGKRRRAGTLTRQATGGSSATVHVQLGQQSDQPDQHHQKTQHSRHLIRIHRHLAARPGGRERSQAGVADGVCLSEGRTWLLHKELGRRAPLPSSPGGRCPCLHDMHSVELPAYSVPFAVPSGHCRCDRTDSGCKQGLAGPLAALARCPLRKAAKTPSQGGRGPAMTCASFVLQASAIWTGT
jgi:hypothetical protein